MRIGLCTPGGGAAGATQAGMLKAFHEELGSENIYAIAGASVGSLNAALFCQGDIDRLWELWGEIKRSRVYTRWQIIKICFSNAYFGVKPLERLIEETIDCEKLLHSPIRLRIQACNADTGQPVIFSNIDPDIKTGLLASASLPIIFPEVHCRGQWLVDGGVSDNTPMQPLIDMGCDIIYVLHCRPHSERVPRSKRKTRVARIGDTVRLLFKANQDKDLARIEAVNRQVEDGIARAHFRKIRVIEVFPNIEIGTLEFDAKKARKGLEDGYEAAKRVLAGERMVETRIPLPEVG